MSMKIFLFAALLVGSLGGLRAQESQESDWQRRFEGHIGNGLGITLLLSASVQEDGASTYDGSYYYHKTGVPICLSQVSLDDEGAVRLRENEAFNGSETFTGEWKVKLKGQVVSGTWLSPDGKKQLPIELKESYPAGSVKVVTTALKAVNTLRKNARNQGREIEVRYVQLASESKAAEAINRVLRQDAHNVPTGGEGDAQGEKVPENPSENDILKALTQAAQNTAEVSDDDEFTYVFSAMDEQKVVMNDHGYLTIEYLTWAYEGGAHGNSSKSYRCFDLETGEEVMLLDLIKPGYDKRWAGAAANLFREQRGLKAKDPLTEAGLFEDRLELNETWYLTPGGIGFSYDPYEIGPYAMGYVEFVLPWKDILADVRPDTRVFEFASPIAARAK